LKKKLLFVGAYPPPYGGIASHLFSLLPQLTINGYDIVSLTVSKNGKVIQNNGMKHIYLSQSKFFYKNILHVLLNFIQCLIYKQNVKTRDFLRVVNSACIINKISNKEQVSAIFIYDNYNGMVIPLLKKHFNERKPLAFMIFGDFYLRPDTYQFISEYVKDIFNDSDVILSSSQYCADSISRILHYNFPVKVIYVGVDHNTFVPKCSGGAIRSTLNIQSTATVFLFIGRMVKEMGLDFVLEIASELLSLDEELYLIVAGAKGSLSEQVKQYTYNNNNVKYCLDISFNKKVEYYAASDVVIAPTMEKHACMGVSIKEAMACAKPIIASNSGGIPEAIDDGINGYLIPIESGKPNKDIFLNRAKKLLREPSLRKIMGQRGRDKVLKSFTNEQTTQKYLNILSKMFQETNN